MTNAALFAKRNPELGILPPLIAFIVQNEVNNHVAQTGNKFVYTETILDLLFEAAGFDLEAFGFSSAEQHMTMHEMADNYLPHILYPAPVMVVDNTR
jgi:hypothetical protein